MSANCKFDHGGFLAASVADKPGATVTADNYLGDCLAAHLQSPDADLEWRGALQSTLNISLPQLEQVDTIVLAVTNLSATSQVVIKGWIDKEKTRPVFDLAVANAVEFGGFNNDPGFNLFGFNGVTENGLEHGFKLDGLPATIGFNEGIGFNESGFNGIDDDLPKAQRMSVITLAKSVCLRELEIEVIDPDNADGYVSIKRIKIGEWVQLGQQFEWGYQLGVAPDRSNNKYRSGQVSWRGLSMDEVMMLDELAITHGSAAAIRDDNGLLLNVVNDVVWMGWPGRGGAIEARHTALVAITDWSPAYEQRLNNGVSSMRIEEVYYDER